MKHRKIILLATAFFACILAHGQGKQPVKTKRKAKKDVASYYADRFHGRKMANGERYHRDSFTCAHLKFAFGTILKVRNPVNQKECLVEVTDRGPYSKKFTIDLSRAAARHLGIIQRGYMPVEITPYYSGTVPYKLGPIEYPEIPELVLNYEPAVTYPYPVWRKDTTQTAKEPELLLPLSK